MVVEELLKLIDGLRQTCVAPLDRRHDGYLEQRAKVLTALAASGDKGEGELIDDGDLAATVKRLEALIGPLEGDE